MVFLGVPHSTTTSDIYNGYFIPKGLNLSGLQKVANDSKNLGVVVIANTWQARAMLIVNSLE
jgi:hypothetical protein